MDFAEGNRKHWDDYASKYDSKPWQQKIVNQLLEEIRHRLDWIGVEWIDKSNANKPLNKSERTPERNVRVLDYACGPGNVSKALAPYASELRGIDISENMVREYNARAINQDFSPSEMFATVGDLLDSNGPSPSILGSDFYEFDLAVVGMGFHHFEQPALAIKRLAERLKPGKGVALIIDMLPHSKEDMPAEVQSIIAHHGFGKDDVETMFREAGCEDFDFVVLDEPIRMGDDGKIERKLFMARGRRQK
ncbi:MAG: hypothetical protein M1812_002430 [Candelaria pacifica]|nr:MAG: hypothetical protein M1812_002430 [Candelaria pacifica]